MMIVRSFLLFFSLMLTINCELLYAKVKPEQIRSTVSEFMASYQQNLINKYDGNVRIEYTISALDNRIAMNACAENIVASIREQYTTGRLNVKVSCLKGNPWSLYVPVKISLYRNVVVTNTPLDRNSLLSESVLTIREINISQLRGTYFTSVKDASGMQTKRALPTDTVLTSNHVEQPLVIKRGEAVLVTANSGGLVVKSTAIALTDGRLGQQISVRNKKSKRVIDATVTAPGQVSVLM